MRYLLLSSLLVLALSCGESPYRNLQSVSGNTGCLDKFKPGFSSVLYNTYVNVKGKHLSGLLLFKKMPDSSIRVIFSSEMGVKFFDFNYTQTGFKVEYCIKQLNRKIVIRQLQKVIGLVLMYNIDTKAAKPMRSENESYYRFPYEKEEIYYVTDKDCNHLLRIESASKKAKKIVANLTDYRNGMADSLYIAYQKFEFNISLKQLQR